MTIKGVIFDLGSTLIEFHGEWNAIMSQSSRDHVAFLTAHGLQLDADTFIQRHRELVMLFIEKGQHDWIEYSADKVLKIALEEFGYADVPQDVIDASLKQLYGESESFWQPFPDTYITLDTLRGAGYKLAIISNARDASNVNRLIDNAKLRSWFDPILISADLGVRKPNPRIFKAVLDQWQLPPTEVVMVGDMLGADVLGAINSGMRSVWATMQADNNANEAHSDTIHPDATIQSLSELIPLIKQW